METVIYGNLQSEALEVVFREGRYFLRYDAGTHQMAWREDELTEEEFQRLRKGRTDEYQVIIGLQRRLTAGGTDPHKQNWDPPKGNA
jgi:hypothetical protein